MSVDPGENDQDLPFHGKGNELVLFQDLDHPLAPVELRLRRLVQLGAELGKGGQLPILGQIQAEAPRHLPHRLDLGAPPDPRDRQPHVHRGPNPRVEEVRLEINLPVGDGDHIGRDVGRDIAELRLDDRQRGERAATQLIVELGGPLQESGMQVKDVARVRLAPGRPSE